MPRSENTKSTKVPEGSGAEGTHMDTSVFYFVELFCARDETEKHSRDTRINDRKKIQTEHKIDESARSNIKNKRCP